MSYIAGSIIKRSQIKIGLFNRPSPVTLISQRKIHNKLVNRNIVKAGISPDIFKYGIPIILVLGVIGMMLRGSANELAAVEENFRKADENARHSSKVADYFQIGNFTFNQKDVEKAYTTNPDKFIDDVLNYSIELKTMDENSEAAKYRLLCLFARNIFFVDSACSSAILQRAKLHFEKSLKAGNA